MAYNSYVPKGLSEQESKLVTSLHHKKYRDQLGLFIAEGEKVITDLLQAFTIKLLIIDEQKEPISLDFEKIESSIIRTCPTLRMKKLSCLDSPRACLAIFESRRLGEKEREASGITLCLDHIQNPGNMGTLIRLCDWLGIRRMVCSEGCVDIFNPKVVQSSAGAMCTVSISEDINLVEYLQSGQFNHIIGTEMQAPSIREREPISEGERLAIIFGNEGRGVAPMLREHCTEWISIPPASTSRTDSLNVSISAAIILSKLVGLSSGKR